MKKMYSLCVRFDLSDNRQARISKHLQSLHENTCQSINGFVIDAIANYIDYQSYTREQLMEDMRTAMREEMQRMHFPRKELPQQMHFLHRELPHRRELPQRRLETG